MTQQELLALPLEEAISRTIRVYEADGETIVNGTILKRKDDRVLVEWEDGYENSSISLLSQHIIQII